MKKVRMTRSPTPNQSNEVDELQGYYLIGKMATSQTPEGSRRNSRDLNIDEDNQIININLNNDKFMRSRAPVPAGSAQVVVIPTIPIPPTILKLS